MEYLLVKRFHGVDPQACLTDVLSRIVELPANRLDELLPWNWQPENTTAKAIAA